MEIKKQKIKTGKFSLKIKNVYFVHEFYSEETGNAPIELKLISNLIFELGNYKIEREIKNTIYINDLEDIYKEIILHSQHIILTNK